MKVLLDTNAWLWMRGRPERLTTEARDAIGSVENTLLLSVISVWEVGIKHATGRLRMELALDELVRRTLALPRARLLVLELPHVRDAAALPREHGDPFDRALAAQALVEDATLITSDPIFARYRVRVLRT